MIYYLQNNYNGQSVQLFQVFKMHNVQHFHKAHVEQPYKESQQDFSVIVAFSSSILIQHCPQVKQADTMACSTPIPSQHFTQIHFQTYLALFKSKSGHIYKPYFKAYFEAFPNIKAFQKQSCTFSLGCKYFIYLKINKIHTFTNKTIFLCLRLCQIKFSIIQLELYFLF